MATHWTLPENNYVKLNVHGRYSENPFPNGNNSGIGCVIRDSRGKILDMLTGSLGGLTAKRNQLVAWVLGLRLCYGGKHDMVILETDNTFAYEANENFKEGNVSVGEKKELESLGVRNEDKNLSLEVSLVKPWCNKLVICLAQTGGETRSDLLVIKKPFGRILDICYEDLGLGTAWMRFTHDDEGEVPSASAGVCFLRLDHAPMDVFVVAEGGSKYDPIEDQEADHP